MLSNLSVNIYLTVGDGIGIRMTIDDASSMV